MVCIHGARDARCGVLGPKLLDRLSQEQCQDEAAFAAAGSSEGRGSDKTSGAPIRLWGTSHFGGHRFAPCAIVMPGGHWYGKLPYELPKERTLPSLEAESLERVGTLHTRTSNRSLKYRNLLRALTNFQDECRKSGENFCELDLMDKELCEHWRGCMGLTKIDQIKTSLQACSEDRTKTFF